MTTLAASPRLSTTSEGLWLAAALAGVDQLPPVLKVRPIGAATDTVTDHPGVAVLEAAGVCSDGAADPDVARWLAVLGRPDMEVDVLIHRPETAATGLCGPPRPFEAPADAIEAAEALAGWHAQRPPQRAVALCRCAGMWVSAARMWRAGPDAFDEVVIGPLGATSITDAVCQVLGASPPTRFHGINVEAAVLEPLVLAWQANTNTDIVAALSSAGLSVPQAKVVQAIGDASATRAVVRAAQFSVDGPCWAPLAVTVVDTLLGRVVLSNTEGPDGRQWTTILQGADSAVVAAVEEVLESLPCGSGWHTHQRVADFSAN